MIPLTHLLSSPSKRQLRDAGVVDSLPPDVSPTGLSPVGAALDRVIEDMHCRGDRPRRRTALLAQHGLG